MSVIPGKGHRPAEYCEIPETCYQQMFELSPIAGLLVKCDGRICKMNRCAVDLFSLDSDRRIQFDLLYMVCPEDRQALQDFLATIINEQKQQKIDLQFISADGKIFLARLIGQPIEGQYGLCQITILELNDQPKDENVLTHLAYYDQLTGLPNRLLFSDRLHYAIRDARRQSERLAVMVIDLDNFKQINDNWGHEAGDQLLKTVSERMKTCLRESDTLSRMGGDEFTVLMLHIQDTQDAAVAAGRLLDVINQPMEIQGNLHSISASIGVCQYPEDGDTADHLIHNADIAMYRAKTNGRSQIAFFSPSFKDAISRQSKMERQLRQALAEDKLDVYYQPLFDTETNQIVGLEALMRWQSEIEGIMSAGQFLPIADQLGLALSFEDWVLKKACFQMKDWLERGIIQKSKKCRMAVNLSTNQLLDPDLPVKIRTILTQSGLPARFLALEIAEKALLQAAEPILSKLKNLCDLGISLYLDDFSQGFNSLQTIKKIPFELLKIDQLLTPSFVENQDGEALLVSLLNLSHFLGLKVVAEGVENEKAYAFLKTHACDGMQGYFFCQPLPALKMEMLLSLPQSS